MSIDTSSRGRTTRPILRILFSALAVMVLSGCAAVINPSMITSAIIDGISYATTGKGPADHLISGITDKDCAIHRGFIDQPVCNPAKDEADLTGGKTNSEDGHKDPNPDVTDPVEAAARLDVR